MVINTAFNLLESFIIDHSTHIVCWGSFQVLTEVWMKVLFRWSGFLRLVQRMHDSALTDWIEFNMRHLGLREQIPQVSWTFICVYLLE